MQVDHALMYRPTQYFKQCIPVQDTGRSLTESPASAVQEPEEAHAYIGNTRDIINFTVVAGVWNCMCVCVFQRFKNGQSNSP